MVAFTDRVEAVITVPSGGAAMSVSHGAYSAAQTVTLGAGTYYLTAAGGVSSLLTTMQTALNENVQGYPQTTSAMTIACGGYGLLWQTAWLMNESSGTLVDAMGAANFVPSIGTAVYGNAGPRGGIDKAVSFGNSTYQFSAGDVLDAATDITWAWVAKLTTVGGANGDILGKGWAVAPGGQVQYLLARESDGLTFYVKDAAGGSYSSSCAGHVGSWHVGIAVLDRAAGKVRIATQNLDTSSQALGPNTAIVLPAVGSAQNLTLGNSGAYGAATNVQVAALFAGGGGSVAAGFSTNIATAIASLASAVNSSFSVSMSTTTGLVTCSNSFWPGAIDFTSTDLRDVLGYAYDFNYPQTPTVLTAALGYGQWTTAYACDETSGNLTPIAGFGSIAGTATSTPTYSNQGARGGSDKAVGFDSAADAFNFGDNYDVDATQDLITVWVGKWSSAGNGDLFSKLQAGVAGWAIYKVGGVLRLTMFDGVDTATCDTSSMFTNEHYVGIAALDRAAGTLRLGIQGLRSGTQVIGSSTSATLIGNISNASSATLGSHAGAWADGSGHQVSYLAIGVGLAAAAGIPANMATALTNLSTYMKSQTGTQQARGLWFSDCPLFIDGDPEQAPLVTDRRSTLSPTKRMFALCGNSGYEHTGLVYSHVPRAQVWDSAATYENGSWEEFARDCIFGLGHEWFTASSALQFYWYDGSAGALKLLGAQGNSGAGMAGWQVLDLSGTNPKRSEGTNGATTYFRIEFGTVVTDA